MVVALGVREVHEGWQVRGGACQPGEEGGGAEAGAKHSRHRMHTCTGACMQGHHHFEYDLRRLAMTSITCTSGQSLQHQPDALLWNGLANLLGAVTIAS